MDNICGPEFAWSYTIRMMTLVMQHVRYLNVDLVIESKSDLAKIVEEFGEDVSVLYCGEMRGYQHASFEIPANPAGADETIMTFVCLWNN